MVEFGRRHFEAVPPVSINQPQIPDRVLDWPDFAALSPVDRADGHKAQPESLSDRQN